MQSKTTRAFRTISEAGEELDLQPHVLRFWESKFPQIKPIKRGGGRRFYRPEDIEFLRGIKILLHNEKHPIKDVQKLIRVKGAQRVIDLGRSVEQAARPKDIEDTVLIPERIRKRKPIVAAITPVPDNETPANEESVIRPVDDDVIFRPGAEPPIEPVRPDMASNMVSDNESMDDGLEIPDIRTELKRAPKDQYVDDPALVESNNAEVSNIAKSDYEPMKITPVATGITAEDRSQLEVTLAKLQSLRSRWDAFKIDPEPN